MSSSVKLVQQFRQSLSSGEIIPVFKLAALYGPRIAIDDWRGCASFSGLLKAATRLAEIITESLGGQNQKTVAYLCPGDASHIISQWAIWMTGNIGVPLSPLHPPAMLEYYLQNSGASLILSELQFRQILPTTSANIVLNLEDSLISSAFSSQHNIDGKINDENRSNVQIAGWLDGKFYASNDALILYTSGTTSKPKGVVYSFDQISAQISSLHKAWDYKPSDVLLHTLPLHHVHGQINSMNAGLAAGARIRMLKNFTAQSVWSHLLGINKKITQKITVFMGVPSMYSRLINDYEKLFANNTRQVEYIKSYLSTKVRLMVSGSAPLPNTVFRKWKEISGHSLLERYGMTEIGMALSNPYLPIEDRTPGTVGLPMPGVSVRIVSSESLPDKKICVVLQSNLAEFEIKSPLKETDNVEENLFTKGNLKKIENKCLVFYENCTSDKSISGELQVKGRNVFKKYWQLPEQTKSEFTEDDWFKTGDTAIYENGSVRILGRTSVDIIKSGGYKISALELETILLNHPNISDIAVLGLPDLTWGEKVAAIIVLKEMKALSIQDLQKWASDYVPKYQLPTVLHIVPELPRNAMGKVNKKELKQDLMK